MEDVTYLVQKIINQVIENIFPKDTESEINTEAQYFKNHTNGKPTVIEIERKLSEISAISSGFEDSSCKTPSGDVKFRISTPENKISTSYEEFFNDTIEEAINKFELEEKFKEASVQTSPSRIDRECQCDLIIKIKEPPNKKIKTGNFVDFGKCTPSTVTTPGKENIPSEGMEGYEKSFSKQTPRIRVGLSKRARCQPLHTKLII